MEWFSGKRRIWQICSNISANYAITINYSAKFQFPGSPRILQVHAKWKAASESFSCEGNDDQCEYIMSEMTMAIMMRMRILILGWKLDNAILNERNDENDYGKPYWRCFPWKEWWLMSVHRSSSRKREYRKNSKLVHSFTLTGQKFSIRF